MLMKLNLSRGLAVNLIAAVSTGMVAAEAGDAFGGGRLSGCAGLTEALSSWVQEESGVYQQAGYAGLASRMRSDILPERIRFSPAPEHLCPPIPDFKNNPIAADALKRVETLIGENNRYPKKFSYERSPPGGGEFYDMTQEALLLTQAFCHPQSPYAGSPKLVGPMLRRFTAIYDRLSADPKQLFDFGVSPGLTDMYLLLKTSCPDLIIPSLQEEWEAAIRRNTEAIVAKKRAEFESSTSAGSWVNADIRYIETLYLASVLFNDPSYRRLADQGLNYVAMSLLPDGAFHYVHLQNEVFTYHEANIVALARMVQIADVSLAHQLIVGSRWYYPLSIEPRGVAEYSTASFWKPYWNRSTGGGGATIVADVCDCPHNARVARIQPVRNPTLWMAAFYRSDLDAAPAEDNFILYDRNIQGARGRFGDYSFSATARDYEDDNRGKGTFVGCILLYPEGKLPEGVREGWPLNAAVHQVANQVRFAHGRDDFRRMNHHSLAQNEKNACAVTGEVVGLTTVHSLSHYASEPVPWEGQQQWILTPWRMAGLVRLTALEEQRAYSIGGTVKTVSGRQFWGIAHPWQNPEDHLYQYGGIHIRIHDTDYPVVTTANIDTFSGNVKKSGRLELLDNESEQQQITYEKGHSRFFLTEIYPECSGPAKSVTHNTLENGLVELTLVEADSTQYRIVHNPENGSKIWKMSGDGSFIRNGAQYRPDWLGDSHPGMWELLQEGQTVSIPAYEFVLVKSRGEVLQTGQRL